jgi:ribosomal-protein-alanine N-acetyltransferase
MSPIRSRYIGAYYIRNAIGLAQAVHYAGDCKLQRMIRPAQFDDLSAILAIEQSAPTAAHWSDAVYQAILDGEERRTLLVAEEAGQIAGFAVAASAGVEWELENIVVPDAFRGRGIGAQLLQALVNLAQAAGAEELHAEIRESNPAIKNFYSRVGFKEVGRRTKYYALPPEDAILMRLLISRP